MKRILSFKFLPVTLSIYTHTRGFGMKNITFCHYITTAYALLETSYEFQVLVGSSISNYT